MQFYVIVIRRIQVGDNFICESSRPHSELTTEVPRRYMATRVPVISRCRPGPSGVVCADALVAVDTDPGVDDVLALSVA